MFSNPRVVHTQSCTSNWIALQKILSIVLLCGVCGEINKLTEVIMLKGAAYFAIALSQEKGEILSGDLVNFKQTASLWFSEGQFQLT